MKTQLSYRATALFMAVLMFVSSTVAGVDVHFCGNEVQSFNLYGKAAVCEHHTPEKTPTKQHACCHKKTQQHKSCHSSEAKGKCCHNETYQMDTEDGTTPEQISIQLQQNLIAVIIINCGEFQFIQFKNKLDHFHYFHPPPLTKDITVLHQVFRI